jgi:hypothetical protein
MPAAKGSTEQLAITIFSEKVWCSVSHKRKIPPGQQTIAFAQRDCLVLK